MGDGDGDKAWCCDDLAGERERKKVAYRENIASININQISPKPPEKSILPMVIFGRYSVVQYMGYPAI